MTTDCIPPPPPPEETPGTPILVPPAPGRSRLVTYAKEPPPVLTANRETDAVTALKRGLKEYLEQVYLDVSGVRIRFEQVFDVWADTDSMATYPSAAIMAVDSAAYDYSSLTPTLDPKMVVLGNSPAEQKIYLVKYAEVMIQLACEVHCSSSEERIGVAMMLEDALNPVDWMYGFKLDLPHYFNQRAVYEPMSAQMVDSEGDARRRWRPGTLFLAGQVSLLRARALPNFAPSARVEVVEGGEL